MKSYHTTSFNTSGVVVPCSKSQSNLGSIQTFDKKMSLFLLSLRLVWEYCNTYMIDALVLNCVVNVFADGSVVRGVAVKYLAWFSLWL